ncbi:type II toxin-antitoxin system HipA family toxin [Microbacterium sp. NPDC090281]|uniref:type II toxin-antitoxin system HipA family toxin n=1 Tax=Microbacterium sp. NPDC090281 TaxID=3364208 RepID=UPI00382CEB81
MSDYEVYGDDRGEMQLVGQAHFISGRSFATTFLYDAAYLAGGGVNIDPSLQLVPGPQYQSGMLRAFSDSSPDRWGRNLIGKGERIAAREAGRGARSLDEVSYLLGVSDDTRQGALRFRALGAEDFLGAEAHVPAIVELPNLLRRSDELAGDDDYTEAVKQLLDTGTTGLGGARPKASVRLEDGALGFAKFPHPSDGWDVMAWEATSLGLLSDCGIAVPEFRLTRLGERCVLILRRFDRDAKQQRVGYISAMTAIGATDGEHHDYVEIADAIRDIARSPRAALADLYDRVIVNVALGNTDDHLRNHGLLRDGNAWTLSPAFDVNPNPDLARSRSTSIAGADTYDTEIEGLLALADDCDLTQSRARERMASISETLSSWPDRARRNRIAEKEISRMGESIAPRLDLVAAAGRK